MLHDFADRNSGMFDVLALAVDKDVALEPPKNKGAGNPAPLFQSDQSEQVKDGCAGRRSSP